MEMARVPLQPFTRRRVAFVEASSFASGGGRRGRENDYGLRHGDGGGGTRARGEGEGREARASYILGADGSKSVRTFEPRAIPDEVHTCILFRAHTSRFSNGKDKTDEEDINVTSNRGTADESRECT